MRFASASRLASDDRYASTVRTMVERATRPTKISSNCAARDIDRGRRRLPRSDGLRHRRHLRGPVPINRVPQSFFKRDYRLIPEQTLRLADIGLRIFHIT